MYDKDGLVQSFYHRNIHPPVVKSRTVYRNDQDDVETTYFDETGKQLFSVRKEEISKLHKRRYFNGQLIGEGMLTGNKDNPNSASHTDQKTRTSQYQKYDTGSFYSGT